MALIIIAIALTAIISIQFGYTLQKVGVHTIFEKSKIPRLNDKHFWYWVIGTAITFLASFLFFFALSEGEISTIQPLTGIGPIVLALIVTYYLKESLRKLEWFAIGISSLGVIYLSLTYIKTDKIESKAIDEISLFILTSIIIILVLIFSFVFLKANIIKVGVVEGLSAGLIGGLPSLYAKLAIPKALNFDFLHWSVIMLIIAQGLTFGLLQRGLHVGKAAVVASLFTATSILLPVGLAQFYFHESININQIIAILLIISGAVLMSKRSEEIEIKLGDEILPLPISIPVIQQKVD